MDLTGRRRLTVLAIGLLLLTACNDDAEPSPDTQPGDTVLGRLGDDLDVGKRVDVVTPAGRLSVAFADPVDHLDEDRTTDLRERNAPDGGAFLPLVWSFQDDRIFGEITQVFGDAKPLELDLVVDGETYPLTPPSAGAGKSVEYVAIGTAGDEVDLEVTYDKKTQTLDGETGELDMGEAEGLYDLVDKKLKIKKCPIKKWFTNPAYFVQFACQYLTAVPSPYVYNHWAEPGHTYLSIRLATNLALFATGTSRDSVASYDVRDVTDLTTIDGEKPLGTIEPVENGGALSGILVFDVDGELPETLDVLLDYKLSLSGAAGEVVAPERRSVKFGGELEILY